MSDPLNILPFLFLDTPTKHRLRGVMGRYEVPKNTRLICEGDDADDRVFLLTRGSVDVFAGPGGRRLSTIDEGHYFGERTALFGGGRSTEVITATSAELWILPAEELRELLRSSPVFARAFGDILRDKQSLLAHFDRFLTEIRHSSNTGHIIIPRLLHLYKPLHPALHKYCASNEIDFSALDYVLARLPANVSSTVSWFMVDDLPELYSNAQRDFPAVPTAARRRAVWEMLPGKNLVLLRDGLTDLVDLVCCLCVYAVEARKIRERMGTPEILQALAGDGPTEEVLASLPFTEEELAELKQLWPGTLRKRLHEISLHHEDFAITVLKDSVNYNTGHSESWTRQVAIATERLLGMAPGDIPADLPVHIISSNTHSVTNCLSPWLRSNRQRILTWGQANRPDITEQHWVDERDLAVALSRPFLAAHPEERDKRRKRDDCEGVQHLFETAFTGIDVQLFDLSALPDPAIPNGFSRRSGLVINIDYAFGQQAEPIIAGLIKLFAHNVRSVNVLGKAGGLQGKRGDLIVANSFVEQLDDTLFTPECSVDLDRLRARVPDRSTHVGRALTAAGTLLQNAVLLKFYSEVWGCVGLEMEGAWYCRRMLEAQQLGILRKDVALRFLYYVSDLPLHHESSLSSPMSLSEGIPPLYAATREVLAGIWES